MSDPQVFTGRRTSVSAAAAVGRLTYLERAPQELRGCLLQLLEATPGLVLAADTQGRILYLNTTGRSLLGVSADALYGLRLEHIFSADSFHQLRDQALPSCLKFGHWHGDLALLGSSGCEIPVSQVLTAHRQSETEGRRQRTVICGIAWDMRVHKQTVNELRHRATHDGLTGLPNRTLLLDRLTHAIRTTGRYAHQRLGVMFFDLDSFKKVNDTFGHEAGDQLLREVGTRLGRRVRASDTIARYGGDEFVLVQPGLSSSSDAQRGVRMLTELFEEPFSIAGRRIRVSASIGVAIYPDDAEEAEGLLRRADAELYAIKRNKSCGRVAEVGYASRPRVERNPGLLPTTPPSPA